MPTLVEYSYINIGAVYPRRGDGWFARKRFERLHVHKLEVPPGGGAYPFSFRLPASARWLHSLTVCTDKPCPLASGANLGRVYAEADKRRISAQLPLSFGGPMPGFPLSFAGGSIASTQALNCAIRNPLVEGVFIPAPLPAAAFLTPFDLYLIFDYGEEVPQAPASFDVFIQDQIQT